MREIYSTIEAATSEECQQNIKKLHVRERLKTITFENVPGMPDGIGLFDVNNRRLGFMNQELAAKLMPIIKDGIYPEVYVSAISGGNGSYYVVNIQVIVNYDIPQETDEVRERINDFWETYEKQKEEQLLQRQREREERKREEEERKQEVKREAQECLENPNAAYQRGKECYDREDYAMARVWLEKAADAGHIDAIRLLIIIYGPDLDLYLRDATQERRWRRTLAKINGNYEALEGIEKEYRTRPHKFRNWLLGAFIGFAVEVFLFKMGFDKDVCQMWLLLWFIFLIGYPQI